MRTRRTSTELAVVAALALTATSGCVGGTSGSSTTTAASVTSTPLPTVDPDDPQAVAYAEAETAYREYFDLSQEIRQRPGMEGWGDLRDYLLGEDVLVPWQTWYSNVSEDPEFHQSGESKLVSVTPTYYEPPRETQSDGSRQVILDVCTDNSETDLAPIVSEVMSYRPPLPDRLRVTYTMTGLPLYTGSESDYMSKDWDWWKDPGTTIGWMASKVEIQEGETC